MPKEIYIDENGNEQILSSSPSALSGLLDTAISSATQGEVLAVDSNGKWANVALSTKEWTYNGRREITGGQTGNWDLIGSIGNAKEILFSIAIGNNQRQPRWSLLMTKADFYDYGCFPDYSLGTDRIYCELAKSTDSQISITGTNVGSVTSKITLICHYR